jgi:hypothetical protein
VVGPCVPSPVLNERVAQSASLGSRGLLVPDPGTAMGFLRWGENLNRGKY